MYKALTVAGALLALTAGPALAQRDADDRAGNNLVAPHSWTFTTGPTPAGIVR